MTTTITTTDISSWIVGRILAYGKVAAEDLTTQTPIADIGLDSVFALTLCGDIEDEYGIDVDPSIFADAANIDELADILQPRIAAA